jgi:hypothetical protein
MAGWTVVHAVKFQTIVDVVPNSDIVDHILGLRCDCHPRKELQKDGPHIRGIVLVHNAFDGRM